LIAARSEKYNRDFEIKCDGQPDALDFVLEIAAGCLSCGRLALPISGIGRTGRAHPKAIVLI
jgi:hypothetical protein